MERKLTCIVCPLGCELTVKTECKCVVAVAGNTCPKGKAYAENECTNPQRTVTSTVRCTDGSLVSVKTDRPIPKEKMMDCMALLDTITAQAPVQVGTVLAANILGTDVNIVATKTL